MSNHKARIHRKWTIHARNPRHNVDIVGKHIAFCNAPSQPNASHLQDRRAHELPDHLLDKHLPLAIKTAIREHLNTCIAKRKEVLA